jgi:hypothetical protein
MLKEKVYTHQLEAIEILKQSIALSLPDISNAVHIQN